jgi:hypothetical protein
LHFEYVRFFWLMAALASAASAVVVDELSAIGTNPNSEPVYAHERDC